MRTQRLVVAFAVAGLLALVVAGCGSSASKSASKASASSATHSGTASIASASITEKPGENPVGQQLYGKKKGGTLTVYSSEDFEHLDPGESYFELDYAVMYATQRPLFTYPPNSADTLVPDLATEMPTTANGGITDGGKTITVHIQPGVKFSPPVNRAVTSADVAYAIERGWNPNVANPYMEYFASLKGAPGKGGPIAGISTPNATTIVFHLSAPQAQVVIGALSLPLSSPVPEEFAAPMDKHAPTTYGSTAEVATGPYMIESNPTTGVFAGLGYQAGKQLTLVRNPNWSASTYSSLFRPPAYVDKIDVEIGGDASVIGAQVLKGSDSVQLDTPANSIVALAYEKYPRQITFTTGSGDHYVALDNVHGVFKNVDIRRAVWANLDRAAIIKERGGSLTGEPGTHFIYPGNQGFTQSGGYAGPNVPWNKDVDGNLKVAEHYMKLAGYPSGKYTGKETVQIVGANNGNSPAIIQIVNQDMTELGLKTKVSEVDQSVMYEKYCGVPKQEIDACPTVGWIRDFADPLTTLYEPFYGPAIVPTNNSNWGQVNYPAINKEMVTAENTINPTQAADDWAKVDDMLVDEAVAVPEDWDNQANIEAGDVAGVNDLWDTGSWDFMYTSLK